MLQLSLSGIKKIESIAQSSKEYISFSQGAIRIGGIPEEIKDHLRSVFKTDKTDYYQSAWGIVELREKIAHLLSIENNCNINTKQVIITHGSIGALSTLFLSILEKDDQVIIPEPAYPAYFKLTELCKAETVTVSMLQNLQDSSSKNYWDLNIEKIKNSITPKTKIIIFSNPSNPTGVSIKIEKILELLKICEQHNIYLIIDEAYRNYSFDNNFKTIAPYINNSQNLILTVSFSKNFAMSGWRAGYMVVPESISTNLGCVQDAIINCPNVPAQYASLYALEHPEIIKNFSVIIKENLAITEEKLKILVDKKIFSYQKPSGGFYIFLKTEFQDSEDLCMGILNKAKVTMIPGKYFGPTGNPFIRLCFARDKEVLIEGLDRIIKFFN